MSHPARGPGTGIDGQANAASRRPDDRCTLVMVMEAAAA